MVRFYAGIEGLEPTKVCYSYIVFNPTSFREGIRYIRHCRGVVKSVIFDTSVEKLFNMLNLRDYPKGFINDYVRKVKALTQLFKGEVIYTIPDIPADYRGREHLYPWNVERTNYYIRLFLEKYVDVLKPAIPMASVQGARDNIASVIRNYEENEDLFNQFDIIALAPTCTTRNWRVLARLIIAFDKVVSRPFHAFGAHIRAIGKVIGWNLRNFRSFDSSAFKYLYKERRLAKTRDEIVRAFLEYRARLAKMGIDVGEVRLSETVGVDFIRDS